MVLSDGEKKNLLPDGSYINNAVHSEHDCKCCRINLLEKCWKTRERNKPSKATQSCNQLPDSQSEPWETIAMSLMQLHSKWKKNHQEDVSLCGISHRDIQCEFLLLSLHLKMDFGSTGKHMSCPSSHDLVELTSGTLRFGSWQPHLITFYSKNVSGQASIWFSTHWKERKSERNI